MPLEQTLMKVISPMIEDAVNFENSIKINNDILIIHRMNDMGYQHSDIAEIFNTTEMMIKAILDDLPSSKYAYARITYGIVIVD